MALTGDETYGTVVAGFVTDATGHLSVTTDATGATFQGGFLRDPDGRLVVTENAASAAFDTGFLRSPTGALVITTGLGDWETPAGFLTDAGALCVTNDPGSAEWDTGFLRVDGALAVTGLVAATLYTETWDVDLAGWTGNLEILTRTTTNPHSAPGSLIVSFQDLQTDPIAQSPAFDATNISSIEFWYRVSGTMPDNVDYAILEMDVTEAVLAIHPVGTISTGGPTTWTQATHGSVSFTSGGVKAAIVFIGTNNTWSGAGPVIDDVLVEGTA